MTAFTSRRSCVNVRRTDDDEDREAQERGSLDDQRLSLAKSFEGARGLRRASKAGRLGRDVVTPHPVHGSSGQPVRARAPDDVDVHHHVE